MHTITIRWKDGTEELRHVPGVPDRCIRITVPGRTAPAAFEREDHGRVYVEVDAGPCVEDQAPAGEKGA